MADLIVDGVSILKPIQPIVRVVARLCFITRKNMHLVAYLKFSLRHWVNRGRDTAVVNT